MPVWAASRRRMEAAAGARAPTVGLAGPTTAALAPFTVDVLGEGWPLTRGQVWQVPAVAQGLQVIAGTVGTLPLERRRGRQELPLPAVLAQPDPDEPREATLTCLVEDLVLWPEAYAVVLARDAEGFPSAFRYVAHELVEPADWVDPVDPFAPPQRRYRIHDALVPAADVLRFPSHWPGLLVVGARALRTSILLEQAAQRFATIDMPAGGLKNTGADLPPDKVTELLDAWETARQTRGIAYLNALVDFTPFSWDPTQLQLVDARRWQTAEVGRLLNLPSRYLNAETDASMTYSTVEAERRDLIDLSLRPYVRAVEARLSMGDVTPRGQTVALELDDFYRGDITARTAYYTAGLAGGWLTTDEVRAAEGLPPLTGGAPNAV